MKIFIFVLCISFFTSCSTGLTSNGAIVNVVRHAEKIKGCKKLSEVRSFSMMGGLLSSKGYENSINDIKNQAGKLEANYVFLFNDQSKMRYELLDGEIFYTLNEAKVIIEKWRQQYNTVRPHDSLGGRAPVPETVVPDWEKLAM